MLKDRRLIGGFLAVLVGVGIQLLGEHAGINFDLNPFEDQELTLSEALMLIGTAAIAYSKKFVESVKAERSASRT